MKFDELTRPWALAHMAGDYSGALHAVRAAMQACVDPALLESLLLAEESTLARLRGDAQVGSCAYCGKVVEHGEVALVGMQMMCAGCASEAGAALRGELQRGWRLVQSVTPGVQALGLSCGFCCEKLEDVAQLAGSQGRYICGKCVATASKNVHGEPCGRTRR